MADKAQVSSVESIEAFRARLIVYVNKARGLVEEVSNEVFRTRQWLQGEQRRFWTDQLNVRRKKLERALSELSSARMSTLQDATGLQQMAVRKAREAMQEAEQKIALLKKWDRELENRAEPLVRQTNPLQHVLNNDMPHALAYLAQMVKTLDEYAGIRSPGSTSATRTTESSGSSLPAGENPREKSE